MQIAQEEMEQPLEATGAADAEATELREESEIRAGSSEDTLATPSDFPVAYNYGSGIQSEWGYNGLYRKLPEPEDNQTVFNTAPLTPQKSRCSTCGRKGTSQHRPNLPKT